MGLSKLIGTICSMAGDLSAQQLVYSIFAMSSLDEAKSCNLGLLADAALRLGGEFNAQNQAVVSSAFLKLLAPTELRKMSTIKTDMVAPQIENMSASRLVQI